MKTFTALVAAIVAALVSACSAQPTTTLADVQSAIEERRFQDAKTGLLQLREANGAADAYSSMLAQVMLDWGDGYSAERYLSELEQSEGESASWVTMSAHAHILQGRARRARELIETFEGEPPRDGTHDWLLVWAAMEEGKTKEAEELVDAALRRHPLFAPLHAKGARLSVWRGNWEGADRHIAEALANDPENYEALLLRGESLIARGEQEGALASYREVMVAYPDFAVPSANVVGLLLDLGRIDEAQSELDRALARHSDFALLQFNLSRLRANQALWEEARSTMQSIDSTWRRSYPAASLLEAEIEAGLGNHAVARTIYLQLADDPKFAEQVKELLTKLPADQ
jgi:predicted Zn-dependent protease